MRLEAIYRYPVKGLSPEPLSTVTLSAGNPLPFDRAFAIENGPSGFDPDHPAYFPKIRFLMLMRDEKLATLSTRFDDQTGMLTIERGGKRVAGGDITTPLGRTLVEQFFAAFMEDALRGPPHILASSDRSEKRHSFSDIAARRISIINLASVRDLERITGRPVDPLRFRGNLHVDGLAPWAELNLVGNHLKLGDGVRLKITNRIKRCAATNVDPRTGQRDMTIPRSISGAFGHEDCGIYAEVIVGGTISTGDRLELETN
ncbi:MAG: MOSC domain-containing protein [Rhodobiaceae bacterium]|nr:MOSC domain-containing protein [Rhodobiaceae bacterium]MCC0056930.1 MOSC domain-containing protein [Rhodobiaceae bacterium]